MFAKHEPRASCWKGWKMPLLSLMTLTFDLWPWPPKSSERWTKHVFRMNLSQIRSAVPDIFHTQTKKSQTAPKTEPYAVHCVQ